MKICYCDESGTGNEPIAVTVGVVVDSQRMRVSKEDWKELLAQLSNMIGSKIDELHTRDFYSGNSPLPKPQWIAEVRLYFCNFQMVRG